MASPDGVPGAANLKRSGTGIGASVLPPFAPCRETSLSCGESSPVATKRPVAAVDLHAIAAAGERNGADVDRHYGAVRQPAAEQHVVGRGHVEQCVGAGVEPLLRLGRHHGGQPGEITGDEAHGVDRVAIGDGQRIGAEFGIALPGAVRRARQDAVAQQADVDRHAPRRQSRPRPVPSCASRQD